MMRKPAHRPRVVGSGSSDNDTADHNAMLRQYFRDQKNALAAIFAEIGIAPPAPPARAQRPIQAQPEPTPEPTMPAPDPLRAEAQAVAARLVTNPDDIVAQRRAAELLNLLEGKNRE